MITNIIHFRYSLKAMTILRYEAPFEKDNIIQDIIVTKLQRMIQEHYRNPKKPYKRSSLVRTLY